MTLTHPPRPALGVPSQGGARSQRGPWPVVGGVAVAAAVLRVAFFWRPMSPDEGGFLLVAAQWGPGTSLYGDYWVDRPPLLLDLFRLADRLGGMVGLRVIGLVVVMVAVLLSGAVGGLVSSSVGAPEAVRARTMTAAAVTAAVFLVSPLSGATEVDGELLAVPFVLAGLALTLAAVHSSERPRAALAGAGAAGAAAMLVKQNEIDVFVFLGVALLLARRQRGIRATALDLAVTAGGALAVLAVVMADAAGKGTGLTALWDAVVTFRLQASATIHSSASTATATRLHHLLLALLVSGAPLLVVQLLRRIRTPTPAGTPRMVWPTLAMLSWEAVSVLGGGSYWLHYLVVFVPGLVLTVAVVSVTPLQRRVSASARPVLAYACAVTAVACGFLGTPLGSHPSGDAQVEAWMSVHARPGDSAVVAFGHPDILAATGMRSPYPDLWSLPVRVHDPRLDRFAAVLAGSDRPNWVVVVGDGLGSWGIDPAAGQVQLARHYDATARVDGFVIYHVKQGFGLTCLARCCLHRRSASTNGPRSGCSHPAGSLPAAHAVDPPRARLFGADPATGRTRALGRAGSATLHVTRPRMVVVSSVPGATTGWLSWCSSLLATAPLGSIPSVGSSASCSTFSGSKTRRQPRPACLAW